MPKQEQEEVYTITSVMIHLLLLIAKAKGKIHK